MTSHADLLHLVTLAEDIGCNPMELLGELMTGPESIYARFPKGLDLLVIGGRKLSPRGSLSQLKQGTKSVSAHLVLNKPDFIEIDKTEIAQFVWQRSVQIERSNAICYLKAGKSLERLTPAEYCLKFTDETELKMGVAEDFVIVRIKDSGKSEIFGFEYDHSSFNVLVYDIYAPGLLMNSISHILKCGERSVGNAGMTRPEWMSEVLWLLNRVWYGILHQEKNRITSSQVSLKDKRERAEHALKLYLRNEVSENLMSVMLQVIFSKKSTTDKLTEAAKNFSFEVFPNQPQFLKIINGLAERYSTNGIKGIAESPNWEAARLDVSKRYGLGKRFTEHLDHIIVRD
ncbi:hypothetical protein Q672_03855 [Marinobacter sp. EVN1]|nr:hypothetical protein Q672_03855 [Marinobacter sp. EVN1]